MSAMLLHVEHLKTAYKSRDGQYVHAVDDVSFDLEEGGTMGIAGESGCGKSTLALSLMGYYFPPLTYLGGRICLDDRDIMQLPYETLRKEVLGRKLAYIPQAAMNALNPTKRIIQFVRDILSEHGQPVSKKEAEKMQSQ